jgi:endonuclease/exonuclease/phosphatase (EEP) superfamily protein YafD
VAGSLAAGELVRTEDKSRVEAKTAAGKNAVADPAKAETKKKFGFKWSGIISGLVIGLLGLASTRLGYVWPVVDFLSALTVHWLFVILSCLFAAIIPKWKTLTAVVLLICCMVAYGAWPLIGNSTVPQQLKPGEVALKIAHYNSRARNKDLSAIEAEIRNLDADVVVLLEMTPDKLPVFDNLRSDYPYVHTCIGQGKCEAAIISRSPFAAVNVLQESNSPPHISVQLGAAQQAVTIIGAHTQRIPNFARQNEHFRNLAKLIEPLTGNIILTGDFNATQFSRAIADLELSTGLLRQTSLPTWPAHFVLPQFAIDHIFLSRNIRVLATPQAGEAGGSDHLPLVMEVALPSP